MMVSRKSRDNVHSPAGNGLADSAQGDGFPIAGGDLVAEHRAQEVLIRAGENETFLFSLEVHDGLDLLLAGARVHALEFDLLHGGGYDFSGGQ